MPNENSATVKVVAKITREYNDLDTRYKKLGVKYIALKKKHDTLLEVHEKVLRNEYNLTDKLKEQRLEIVEDLKIITSDVLTSSGQYHLKVLKKWEGLE